MSRFMHFSLVCILIMHTQGHVCFWRRGIKTKTGLYHIDSLRSISNAKPSCLNLLIERPEPRKRLKFPKFVCICDTEKFMSRQLCIENLFLFLFLYKLHSSVLQSNCNLTCIFCIFQFTTYGI